MFSRKLPMQRHYIQQNILKVLLKNEQASFTEMNTQDISNDHFNFHLKQLLKEVLIEKSESKYKLTPKGLEEAGRIDIESSNLISQPKISITLGVFRNNDSEVLVLERTRAQSLGQYAWLDRKWRMGNSIKQEVDSLLKQEANLQSDNYIFSGATHVMKKTNGKIEIDVVLLNFKISDPKGELLTESKDGINQWFKISEIKKVESTSKVVGFNERLDAYLENKIILQEFIVE
jgi:predicted transcriptional regulator